MLLQIMMIGAVLMVILSGSLSKSYNHNTMNQRQKQLQLLQWLADDYLQCASLLLVTSNDLNIKIIDRRTNDLLLTLTAPCRKYLVIDKSISIKLTKIVRASSVLQLKSVVIDHARHWQAVSLTELAFVKKENTINFSFKSILVKQ